MAKKVIDIIYNLVRKRLAVFNTKASGSGITRIPTDRQIKKSMQDVFQTLKDGGYNVMSAEKVIQNEDDLARVLTEIQQKQIAEQQKQLGELLPNIGNTINNNTNIKQKFNINIFLNEKCKGALNIDEFIEKMQLTLNNLDFTKTNGLVDGISNIFIENMNKLSLYERPVHCTDTKRDILYIKDKDAWEKDIDKSKIKEALQNLNTSHFKLVKEWIEKNPDFIENEDKQEYFSKLLQSCGTDLEGISNKVIKKICNSAYLKEELKIINEIDD